MDDIRKSILRGGILGNLEGINKGFGGENDIEKSRKKYNVGDISPVTGLQKQADGSWKPTKKESKKSESESNKKSEFFAMVSGDVIEDIAKKDLKKFLSIEKVESTSNNTTLITYSSKKDEYGVNKAIKLLKNKYGIKATHSKTSSSIELKNDQMIDK